MFPKHELSATLSRLLGIPESRCDPAPEKRGEIDLGEVVVEKWLFAAELGSRIPLNLYRPRQMTEPIPAIVMTCGHGDSKGVPHMTYLARTYARAGIACLAADPLGEEERHHEGGWERGLTMPGTSPIAAKWPAARSWASSSSTPCGHLISWRRWAGSTRIGWA